MSDADFLRDRFLKLRPTAKHFEVTPSSEFPRGTQTLDTQFHYVSIYDERIDLHLMETPRGPVVVENTYVSSFAYNLVTCWIVVGGQATSSADFEARIAPLLTFNFKKFFAEQLFWRINNCFSRAILFETMLYEQRPILAVFGAREGNETLKSRSYAAGGLMTYLCTAHELGHFMCDRHPGFWNEFIARQPASIRSWFIEREKTYPAAFMEEVKCDWIACALAQSDPKPAMRREETLRAMVFGFASFAVFYSLEKSAAATAQEQALISDKVDFSSVGIQHHDTAYTIGLDRDFFERACAVEELVTLLAESEGLELYGDEPGFRLPKDFTRRLIGQLDSVMNADSEVRKMSMLVAEAFDGHRAGAEYLYARSKRMIKKPF